VARGGGDGAGVGMSTPTPEEQARALVETWLLGYGPPMPLSDAERNLVTLLVPVFERTRPHGPGWHVCCRELLPLQERVARAEAERDRRTEVMVQRAFALEEAEARLREVEAERDEYRASFGPCDDVNPLVLCCPNCNRSHHVVCPKIAEAERDELEARLRAMEAERDEVQRLFAVARENWTRVDADVRGYWLGVEKRLTAECDAARADLPPLLAAVRELVAAAEALVGAEVFALSVKGLADLYDALRTALADPALRGLIGAVDRRDGG
jgi:hypothetical protein